MAWLGLIGLLGGGLLVATVCGAARCAWVILHPPRRGYGFAVARGMAGVPEELGPEQGWNGAAPRYRSWVLERGGARMPVWELEGMRASGPVVILSHGWGESRVHGLMRVAAAARFSSRVMLWDMRGHGEASKRCTLGTAEVEDLLALVEAVEREAGGGTGVVLWGFSLGAGVSIAAAARGGGRVVGVIAEAPYRLPETPARAVLARAGLPVGLVLVLAMWVVRRCVGPGLEAGTFDRAMLAARVRCPMLVLRGALDEVSPEADGRAIATARGEHGEFMEIPGAGHADIWTWEETRAAGMAMVERFAARVALSDGRER